MTVTPSATLGATSGATLILAGGQSSRMGQDKALIPIQGIPLIRRVYEVARACSPPVYVISPWCDRYCPILPPACRFITEHQHQTGEPMRDRPRSPGPLFGFYQGLTHIQTQSDVEWVLLLACDLPNLHLATLQSWRDSLSGQSEPSQSTSGQFASGQSEPRQSEAETSEAETFQATSEPCSDLVIAALPTHATKGWHPLCGFYHRRCLSSLKSFVETGGRSFQRWLVNESVRSLPVSDPQILFNCNTPDDLARLRDGHP